MGDTFMSYEPEIAKRNKATEHIVMASCGYGLYVRGARGQKHFSMLVTTDIHQCADQLRAAVDYLNYYAALDCGICLGDIQACDYASTDGTWYRDAIAHTEKPFMSILGNHDVGNSRDPSISGSSQQAYEKFIRPTDALSGIEGRESPHFLKIFDEYGIAVIGLDPYGDPSALLADGTYAVHRGVYTFSQKEVDRLCKSLAAIPAGYHLIVALHGFPYSAEVRSCAWSQPDAKLYYPAEAPYGDDGMLCDIIDAWVRGARLKADYPPLDATYLPTLSVDCDFSTRGEGVFIAYTVGHYHRDIQGHSTRYPYQNVIAFPATANDAWQNYCSDLPREKGTRAEDALTVMSVAREKREIRLVRIGSNMTMDMTERTYTVIPY